MGPAAWEYLLKVPVLTVICWGCRAVKAVAAGVAPPKIAASVVVAVVLAEAQAATVVPQLAAMADSAEAVVVVQLQAA